MELIPTRATLLVTPLSGLREWHLVVSCRCRMAPIRIHAGTGDPFEKRSLKVVLLDPKHERR